MATGTATERGGYTVRCEHMRGVTEGHPQAATQPAEPPRGPFNSTPQAKLQLRILSLVQDRVPSNVVQCHGDVWGWPACWIMDLMCTKNTQQSCNMPTLPGKARRSSIPVASFGGSTEKSVLPPEPHHRLIKPSSGTTSRETPQSHPTPLPSLLAGCELSSRGY